LVSFSTLFSWSSSIVKSEVRVVRKTQSSSEICYYKLELEKIDNKAESAKQFLITNRIALSQNIKTELRFFNCQTVFASIKHQLDIQFMNLKLCLDEYIIA